MKLFLVSLFFISCVLCQESDMPSLQSLTAAQIARQITYDQSLKNKVIAHVLNEQISRTVERSLVKSIIIAADKEMDVARRFKDTLHIKMYAHDAKVQSIQGINWQFSNNYLCAASDSSPLYIINTINGCRQTVNFSPRPSNVYSNSLATNAHFVAHAEGVKTGQDVLYKVILWSTNSFKMVNSFNLPSNAVPQTLAISDAGEFLALGFSDSTGRYIKLVEIKSRKEIITIKGTGGAFKGDYFEYYTTPNASDLILNVVALKNDNTINYFEHGDYDCDMACNNPQCLQRKAPHLFTHGILWQHPTEGTVFNYDDQGSMIFPHVIVDQKNNSVGLIMGNNVKIYTLDRPHLVKNFKQFNQATDEVELIAPEGDLIIIRDKNNVNRRAYSIEHEELVQSFKAHVNTTLRFNRSNNVIGWYQDAQWLIAPTHKYILDHANPQDMLKALLEEQSVYNV